MSTSTAKSLAEEQFNVWRSAFSDQECRQQLKDDSTAWGRVTGILMVVVLLGLMISVSAVAIAILMP
jgi:hypothetical protein